MRHARLLAGMAVVGALFAARPARADDKVAGTGSEPAAVPETAPETVPDSGADAAAAGAGESDGERTVFYPSGRSSTRPPTARRGRRTSSGPCARGLRGPRRRK